MIYIPANNNVCGGLRGTEAPAYKPGAGFTGAQMGRSNMPIVPGADHFGEVQAWNIDTGQRVWTHNYPKSPNWGSMLATAGGLVISGGTNDRKIHAFDATNGKLLWEHETPSGILAPPTMFMVDGKQYLAVHSGWGGDSAGMNNTINTNVPGGVPQVPTGGSIWVYALE
jgi:alcohol dehydrogenase (cytochrome c)